MVSGNLDAIQVRFDALSASTRPEHHAVGYTVSTTTARLLLHLTRQIRSNGHFTHCPRTIDFNATMALFNNNPTKLHGQSSNLTLR